MASNILWTTETWNPIVGCSAISPGCDNCYARSAAQSPRLQQFPQYQKVKDWDGTVSFAENQLLKPLGWRKGRKVFVCSMSDLFHVNVLDEWIDRIFAVMVLCPQHTFQVLTKRPQRMMKYIQEAEKRIQLAAIALADSVNRGSFMWQYPLPNVWLGTSTENQETANQRIPYLIKTPAAVRFLSCEPLLESIDLSAHLPIEWSELAEDWIESFPGAEAYEKKLHWVIVGGESGTNARPCHLDWLRSIVSQCKSGKVAVFVKQLGSVAIDSNDYIVDVAVNNFKLKLKDRKGGDIDEFSDDLKVRDFP